MKLMFPFNAGRQFESAAVAHLTSEGIRQRFFSGFLLRPFRGFLPTSTRLNRATSGLWRMDAWNCLL